MPKALMAHDNMNKYFDDDSDKALMGDLLLKPIKEEMTEEEYNKEPAKHADMTTVMLQGNLDVVRDIMANLAYAADTAAYSWSGRQDENDTFDDLYEKYEKEYPSVSESKLVNLMIADYDEDAKIIVDCYKEIKTAAEYVDKVKLPLDASEKTAKKYFEEHKDVDELTWASAAVIIAALDGVKFEGQSIAEYAKNDKNDYSDVDNRIMLYPIVTALSDGQRAMLSYTDFRNMIISGGYDTQAWNKAYENQKERLKDVRICSVYTGVLRDVFKPGSVALTGEARTFKDSTGTTFDDGLFGIGMDFKPIVGFTAGLVTLGAGLVLRRVANGSHISVVNESASIKLTALHRNIDPYSDGLYKQLEFGRKKLLELPEYANKEAFQKPITCSGKYAVIYDEVDSEVYNAIKTHFENDHNDYFLNIERQYSNEWRNIKTEWNEIMDKVDEAVQKGDQILETKYDAEIPVEYSVKNSKAYRYVGNALCAAGILLSLASAGYAVYQVFEYYHQDMAPIPRIIVDESTDDKGRAAYTYYQCVFCNREAQGFKNDKLGDYGDMNGDVGKQWIALYTTKDKAAGDPITADIIAQKGSNVMPTNKSTGIRLFGKTDTVNIVSEEFCYNDKLGGLYIFSSTATADAKPAETPADNTDSSAAPADTSSESETSSAVESEISSTADSSSQAEAAEADTSSESDNKDTGSVVGTGTMAVSCVGSAALGALICFLIVRRKKGNNTAA